MELMKIRIVCLALLLTATAQASELPGWMKGSWRSDGKGVAMEEHWTGAGGGLMVGMHREVLPNGKVSFEFLRIESRDGTLLYQAMPGGRPATPFALKSSSDSKIVFENKEHDFPQRIIYWRDGEHLCARVEGTIGGKEESEQWCWTRFAN